MTTQPPEHKPSDLSRNLADRSRTGRLGDLSAVSAARRADTVGHPGPDDTTGVAQALRNLVGARIPGGCDDCHAITHLTEEAPGVFAANVGHDVTCPTWTRIRNGQASR